MVPESINHNQIKKEIFRGKTIKYVYVNLKYQPLEVKEYVKADKCALDKTKGILSAIGILQGHPDRKSI